LKIIVLDHHNDVGRLSIMSNVAKNSDILAISLNILVVHSYFVDLIKLLLDLFKFLDSLAQSFFPY